jgi:hypothetical protein
MYPFYYNRFASFGTSLSKVLDVYYLTPYLPTVYPKPPSRRANIKPLQALPIARAIVPADYSYLLLSILFLPSIIDSGWNHGGWLQVLKATHTCGGTLYPFTSPIHYRQGCHCDASTFLQHPCIHPPPLAFCSRRYDTEYFI